MAGSILNGSVIWSTTRAEATNNGVKVFVYGKSGVGKTVLCKTAPAPAIVSAEGGTLSLSRDEVPVTRISTMAQLYAVYKFFADAADGWTIQTVCLDSGTEIAEVLLATLLKSVGAKDPRKAYGEMLTQMLELFKAFRDLPYRNVYISCKEEWAKDEATGVMKFVPMMPGQKLGPQLPYLFDEVFHMGVAADPATGKKYRYLQTEADIQHDAKDRSGLLDAFEPPDLAHVFRKIKGE